MKPILQREQRLQKYANTHPLRMPTTQLSDHFQRPPCLRLHWFYLCSVFVRQRFYRAPGPEKVPRGLLRSSRGAASLMRSTRPATSVPFRPAIACAAS